VAQLKLCGQGMASHGMVGIRAPECSPTAVLHGRCVERQHWEAEAMAEDGSYFSVLLRQGMQERERVQPSRGRAACTAEEAGAIGFARLRAGVTRGEEGIEAKLGCMPRVGALCFRNVSHSIGVNLKMLRLPQVACALVQGFPLRPQQRASGPIKRRERPQPLAHGGMRGCCSGEVRGESGVRAGQTNPPCRRGRVICTTVGPSSNAKPMMTKAASATLSSARQMARPTGSSETGVPPRVEGCHGAGSSDLGPAGAGPAFGL
jgi:hypothetical protein